MIAYIVQDYENEVHDVYYHQEKDQKELVKDVFCEQNNYDEDDWYEFSITEMVAIDLKNAL